MPPGPGGRDRVRPWSVTDPTGRRLVPGQRPDPSRTDNLPALAGRDFTHQLGVACMVVGALIGRTGELTLSRLETMPARTVFGLPPEREGAGGGRVLTGVGIFLFVGVPLIVVGVLLV